jgi:hypothetical protein
MLPVLVTNSLGVQKTLTCYRITPLRSVCNIWFCQAIPLAQRHSTLIHPWNCMVSVDVASSPTITSLLSSFCTNDERGLRIYATEQDTLVDGRTPNTLAFTVPFGALHSQPCSQHTKIPIACFYKYE